MQEYPSLRKMLDQTVTICIESNQKGKIIFMFWLLEKFHGRKKSILGVLQNNSLVMII